MIINLGDNLKKRVISPWRSGLVVRFGDRNAFKRYATHMFEGGRMDPRELGKLIADRVIFRCELDHIYLPQRLECLAEHSPQKLNEFAQKYIIGKDEENSFKQVVESSPTLWDDVKKEYEKVWNEEMSSEIGYYLSNEIRELYKSITNYDSEKDKLENLKDLANTLGGFRNEITQALKEKKPLPGYKLYNWFYEMGAIALGLDDESGYYSGIDYITEFYEKLGNYGKLEVLKTLLDVINSVLPDINKDLKELSELGVLTNQS